MMDARFWMTDVGKYREITARELVSNPTKESTKDSLMSMSQVEQFPNGTQEVPLVNGVGGYRIGTATVTFNNGVWVAVINLDSDAAKHLGIDLTFSHHSDPLHGDNAVLVAMKHEEIERGCSDGG